MGRLRAVLFAALAAALVLLIAYPGALDARRFPKADHPHHTPQITLAASVTPVATEVPTSTPTIAPSPTNAPSASAPPTAPPSPSVTPSPPSTASPTPTSTPTPSPTPTLPPPANGVRVTSIPALLAALADNSVSDITVANGTYTIRGAGFQASNSLWIGAAFAGRTRAVTIHPETTGDVTFDGGGSALGCISFEEGAHDQTWTGFRFANGTVTETGCITFGGYATTGAHHITLRNITIPSSIRGSGTTAQGYALDHGIYVGHSNDGAHDLLFDTVSVDASGGLASGIQFDGAPINGWNVLVRGLTVSGAQQAVLMWQDFHDVTIDGATITGSTDCAVTYQHPSSGNLVTNTTSTGTPGGNGLCAPNGTGGLSITNSSLR